MTVRSYARRPRAAGVSYNARQVATAYNCPIAQYDGTGTVVGIIELGGAWSASDMQSMGLNSSNVSVVSVDGGKPRSDGPNGADGEVALDVEVVAEVAPGAKIKIYQAANTDQAFADAVAQAVTDVVDAISISWGGPETSWGNAIQPFSQVFAAARAKGIPVFAAAGDSGSRDGTRSNVTDYPASDPNVVGCGGTRLLLNSDGTRASETVWDDSDTTSATGGGVSRVFPGRQVPDVAGNADPVTGYLVTVDGEQGAIGGTSAVAPLYAAMYVVVKQAYGQSFDFLNTVASNPTICFDVVQGDNGGYRAGPGRDDVSGYGVVDMGKMLAVLQGGGSTPPPPPVNPPSADAAAYLAQIAADMGQAATQLTAGAAGLTQGASYATALQQQITAWLAANPS